MQKNVDLREIILQLISRETGSKFQSSLDEWIGKHSIHKCCVVCEILLVMIIVLKEEKL